MAKIIPPLAITTTNLTSSSIAEPDTTATPPEVAWTASTAYAAGDVRIRTTTHRRYQALKAIANTVTTPPENDPTNWTDIGPTNRYAMFDYTRNTASYITSGTSLAVTITPATYTPNVVLTGISAEKVRVQMTSAGATVYDKTIDLSTRSVSSWMDYFFSSFSFRKSAFFLDLPLYSNGVITVTLSRATAGYLGVQHAGIGYGTAIGDAQYGASTDILDFSSITRDAFGNATLVKRKNVPILSMNLMCSKGQVQGIKDLRAAYAATPLIFVGVEDSTDAYADSLAMVGIFKRMSITIEYPENSLINLEAEGI